ncbi:MAG TPA: penicillin-binding protein [Gemmatimonadota bacterium]|nr:penicillin-binding protein [Gemmatimonadota bacterium]
MEPERLKIARRRQGWLFLLLLAFGGRLAWSFVEIQILSHDAYLTAAEAQQKKQIVIPPSRGGIFDRNGVPLAVNREQYAIYLVPRHIADVDRFVERFTAILPHDEADLRRKIDQGGWYARLVRGVPREIVKEFQAADLDGVGVETYQMRHYPFGDLTARLLGRVDVDNQGLEGIELRYDSALRGTPGHAIHQRDALGREYPNFSYPVELPIDGRDVYLTIDVELQEIVDAALEASMERTEARSGSVTVVNPVTGEVLAIANRPGVADREGAAGGPVLPRAGALRNYAVTDQFEPGSTFKIVPLAALYEENLAAPTDSLFCENGVWNHNGRVVRDVHPYGYLTIEEVIEESSNICSVKLTERLGNERLYEYARRFGFGLPSGLDFPGEPRGVLKQPDDWSSLTAGSVAMGYEVMANSLQMVMAYASIANGGELLKPYLVQKIVGPDGELEHAFGPQQVRRVMSPETAALVTQALIRVVEVGTAQRAQIDVLPVAGKTGTARKTGEHGYVRGRYTSSFAGFFPASEAKYVVFVRIDEPVGAFYGGAVAAPVFRESMEGILVTEAMHRSPSLVGRVQAPERVLWTVSDGFWALPPPADSTGRGAQGSRVSTTGEVRPPEAPYDPRREIKVPDLSGLSLREAVNRASRLGLRLGFSGTGRVIDQQPEAGEVVPRGEIVRVRNP